MCVHTVHATIIMYYFYAETGFFSLSGRQASCYLLRCGLLYQLHEAVQIVRLQGICFNVCRHHKQTFQTRSFISENSRASIEIMIFFGETIFVLSQTNQFTI